MLLVLFRLFRQFARLFGVAKTARLLLAPRLRLLFDILALALLLGLISFMLCKPQLLLPALVVFDLDFTLVR